MHRRLVGVHREGEGAGNVAGTHGGGPAGQMEAVGCVAAEG